MVFDESFFNELRHLWSFESVTTRRFHEKSSLPLFLSSFEIYDIVVKRSIRKKKKRKKTIRYIAHIRTRTFRSVDLSSVENVFPRNEEPVIKRIISRFDERYAVTKDESGLKSELANEQQRRISFSSFR